MSDAARIDLDIREQVERIDRLREQHKLAAEALNLGRDRTIIPWQIVATLLGAGAAFVEVLWG